MFLVLLACQPDRVASEKRRLCTGSDSDSDGGRLGGARAGEAMGGTVPSDFQATANSSGILP